MLRSSANQGSALEALGSDPSEFHDGQETRLRLMNT